MTTAVFTQKPAGIDSNQIPASPIASSLTTKHLVSDEEHDAFYFRSLEKSGLFLNENQLEAVRYGFGPLLILAGAGSGKTSVVIARVGYLIAVKNVNPSNILLVTFSKKAADEMKERIVSLPGMSAKAASDITVGTFHSVFLRILRGQGFNQQILSNEKRQHIIIKSILKSLGMQDHYEPETLLELFSYYKSRMIEPEDAPYSTPSEKETKEVYTLYEQYKRENRLMDFDDILTETVKRLRTSEQLRRNIQNRFQFVMVDEFQDTNAVQYETIKLIAAPQNNLCCVGDDDQCIYQFRGSDSRIILDFPTEYPDTKKVTLDINYRSNAYIVGLGNEVIRHNEQRFSKTLKATVQGEFTPFFVQPATSEDEAALIVKKISEEVGSGRRTYSDYAILFRTGSSSRAIFEHLTLGGIPFVSHSDAAVFYEQSIIRPVIDHLRLAMNPNDAKAVEGILPSLYLQRDKVKEFVEWEHFLNADTPLLNYLLQVPDLKSFQMKQIQQRLELISRLRYLKPLQAIQLIRTEANYDKYMEADEGLTLTLHKEIIRESLDELEASAKKFNTVPEFLDFVTSIIEKHHAMEQLRKDPNRNAVTLMTIHKSKGLEFPCVYVIGASETILPHSSVTETKGAEQLMKNRGGNKQEESIEEERRLAYVAITRAREELFISSPSFHRGKKVGVSRFIVDAFPQIKKDTGKSGITIYRPIYPNRENEQQQEVAATVLKEIEAWVCAECSSWKRFDHKEENNMKKCPVCQTVMNKGMKNIEIPVK